MWLVEELDEEIVAYTLMEFSESSGKTSHTVSHSRLTCLFLGWPTRKTWLR